MAVRHALSSVKRITERQTSKLTAFDTPLLDGRRRASRADGQHGAAYYCPAHQGRATVIKLIEP